MPQVVKPIKGVGPEVETIEYECLLCHKTLEQFSDMRDHMSNVHHLQLNGDPDAHP